MIVFEIQPAFLHCALLCPTSTILYMSPTNMCARCGLSLPICGCNLMDCSLVRGVKVEYASKLAGSLEAPLSNSQIFGLPLRGF